MVLLPFQTDKITVSEAQKAHVIAALEDARAQIARGECSTYTEESFHTELMDVYDNAKFLKHAKAS